MSKHSTKYGDLRKKHLLEYCSYFNMMSRCYNKTNPDYETYGGRGIRVCSRWRKGFVHFLRDMGPRPSALHNTLDREDNDGDYMPRNCRWATQKEQARNRGNNRMETIDGVVRCVSEWIEILGLDGKLIWSRLERGWDFQKAIGILKGRAEHHRARKITCFGKTLTITQWAEETGLPRGCISQRLDKEWPPELILTTPSNRGNKVTRLQEQRQHKD